MTLEPGRESVGTDLNAVYQHWLKYETFLNDVSIDTLEGRHWITPLEQLFAGLVYFRAKSHDRAAHYIISACLASVETDKHGILDGKYIGMVREWCYMEGYSFFLSYDKRDLASMPALDAERILATVLFTFEKCAASVCDASSKPASPVAGYKRARTFTDTEARARVRHAAWWFRHELNPKLDLAKDTAQLLIQTLLFYADALHIHENGTCMFGSAPWAYVDGPVYEDARELLKTLEESKSDSSWELPAEERVLESSEIKQLQRVGTALATQPVQVLIALSHTEGPWLAAVRRARRTKETKVEMSVEALEEWFRSPINACVPRAIANYDSHASELLDFLVKSVQQEVT
jgi:uncharacterized phage-associated protein